MFRAVLHLVLLLGFVPAQAQTCIDIFTASPQVEAFENQKLPVVNIKDIPMEDVKLFSQKDVGVLSLFLKTDFKHHKDAINAIHLVLIYKFTQKDIYDSVIAHEIAALTDRGLLQKAKSGDWGSKLQIIRLIKSIEQALAKSQHAPVGNLLLAESWYKIFGATNEAEFYKEFSAQYAGLKRSNQAASPPPTVGDNEANLRERVLKYGHGAFKIERYAWERTGIFRTTRAAVIVQQIPDLIKKLHLPKSREQYFLETYDYIFRINFVSASSAKRTEFTKQFVAIYLFEKAYLEAFPDKVPANEVFLATGGFLNSAIHTITSFEKIYQWNELRIEQSLNLATSLNQQLELFYGDITAALNSTQAIKNLEVKESIVKLWNEAMSLEAKDLNERLVEEYERRISRVNVLHFQLDQLMEQKVVPKQVEDIHSFYDLNYKWARLKVDKPYDINGKDFDRVIFHEDVLRFFERDAQTGSRFLAAINKGYVGAHGENGIRSVHEIHKDFRYIKVVKTGGKIRILGKLIGRDLHLFAIFNRDANFDQLEMHKLIDRYNP